RKIGPVEAGAGIILCGLNTINDNITARQGCRTQGCTVGNECMWDLGIPSNPSHSSGICCPPGTEADGGRCRGACAGKGQYWDGPACKSCVQDSGAKCLYCDGNSCGYQDAGGNLWYPAGACKCCQVGYICCSGFCCPLHQRCNASGTGCEDCPGGDCS